MNWLLERSLLSRRCVHAIVAAKLTACCARLCSLSSSDLELYNTCAVHTWVVVAYLGALQGLLTFDVAGDLMIMETSWTTSLEAFTHILTIAHCVLVMLPRLVHS